MNDPSATARRRQRARLALRLLAALSVVLAGGELALRAAQFSPSVVPHRIVLLGDDEDEALERGDGLLRFDPAELWTLRPGAPIPWAPDERISPRGLRGNEPPLEPTPGTLRVAVLGGSAAFGVEVAFDEAFAGRLGAELDALGVRADVVCAAVPEASIRQTVPHWRATARPFRPDVVVYATARSIGWQPAVDRITDEQKILYLARHPERWREPRLAHGIRVLELWPWLLSVADSSYWRERYAAMEARRTELMSMSGDHPSVRRVSLSDLWQCLDELHAECKQIGARFLLLSVPRNPDGPDASSEASLTYQSALLDWVRAEGVTLINGREAYSAAMKAGGIERHDLFLRDDLPSPLGHAALAGQLAREIRAGVDATR